MASGLIITRIKQKCAAAYLHLYPIFFSHCQWDQWEQWDVGWAVVAHPNQNPDTDSATPIRRGPAHSPKAAGLKDARPLI